MTTHSPTLTHLFATELPELSVEFQGERQPDPTLLILNEPLAADLGVDTEWLRSPEGIEFLLGLHAPPGSLAVAQGYAGHQFGQFVPRLGDGRALLLGEITDVHGNLRDIHLKGSGATPFSRGADGRGALGPMLREYLVSESMHALGVPTTRALAVLATGRRIQRTGVVPGAVLVRVATNHIRVGSFQYSNLVGGIELSTRLADHLITLYHPELAESPQPYLALCEQAMECQARLVAKWMRLGFIHGVMNTDNMLLSGETIDYGPCAFMDLHDPTTVYSSIDVQGRYAYRNQPVIAGWNLARLVETLLPLFGDTPDDAMTVAQELMNSYPDRYRKAWLEEMAASLGIDPSHEDIIDAWAELLAEHAPDQTSINRLLINAAEDPSVLPEGFHDWAETWRALSPDTDQIASTNPIVIPRNHLVDEALRSAEVDGDLDPFLALLRATTDPFSTPTDPKFTTPAPEGFDDTFRTYCGT